MEEKKFKHEMAVEDNQTKRTSVKSYASRVFQESSVGMVSSLAHTHSSRRRIFKVLALILCLTGFLYQSGKFLAVVFQYPSTVDIDIMKPTLFNVPAYTFCDNNGINRRIFCKKFPDKCEKPSEAFCKKYDYYCGENETLVPKKEYYKLNTYADLEELIDLNVNQSDFVSNKGWSDEEITGPYLRMVNFGQPRFMCYSLNGRVNNSLYPLQSKREDIIIKLPVDILEFTVESDEVFVPGNRPGIIFAVHSPFQAVNPFKTGIFMKPGRTYMIFIDMEEEILLKEPYDTNCVNYTEIWEKNDYAGPRFQDMCKQDCLADISMQCFNCVVPMLLFPRDERYCLRIEDIYKENCPEDAEVLFERCDSKCRDDCRQTKYTYNVQERFSPEFKENGEIKDDLYSTIKVEIYVEQDEIIVLKHSPKYMVVEVFSNIGGFIGCWLGINLLDFTDIFEGFFRILRYSLKRR